MFERYTEKARRVIFFARYEASEFGSPTIESEHMLLGLLRENPALRSRWMPGVEAETVRQWIKARASRRDKVSTSIDLPLSDECRKVLKAAADEADLFGHHRIGTDHLLLGLLDVNSCFGAELLQKAGADAKKVRNELATHSEYEERLSPGPRRQGAGRQNSWVENVVIHGSKRNTEYVRDLVSTIRSYNWHWHKTQWKPRDIVIHRKNGEFSFDLSLAEDSKRFILVKDGWKKDHCDVCRWELRECDDEHGVGYTNGRTWLCIECCERFILGDYFASSHPEIT